MSDTTERPHAAVLILTTDEIARLCERKALPLPVGIARSGSVSDSYVDRVLVTKGLLVDEDGVLAVPALVADLLTVVSTPPVWTRVDRTNAQDGARAWTFSVGLRAGVQQVAVGGQLVA